MARKKTNAAVTTEEIAGRLDLMTALVSLEYSVATRSGKLYLARLCTVNYSGCIRLFTDIDPQVVRIEVFSGDVPDGVYFRDEPNKEWKIRGFPFR